MRTRARIVTDFASIRQADWERLDHGDNPFVSHAFLASLESSGTIDARSGWTPQHLALFERDRLVACAPTYIKTNSHGEFVFDWAWADAYQRHGLPYYPKLLTAVPYSPVTGPRLLTRADHPGRSALRERLVELALELCEERGFSSWHCNFTTPADRPAFESAGLLSRTDCQFHWRNDGYGDFGEYLGRLKSRKRKNVRRERRQVEEAGIQFRWKTGDCLTEDDLEFVYSCYVRTFRLYGNHPALTRRFFAEIAAGLGGRMRVAFAVRHDQPVAMSLFLTGGGRLYGRYWGSVEELPALHFEAAYYQGIDHCIKRGLNVFESGAQGEHKVSRGFMPVRTRSFHHLREPVFRNAIAQYLDRERALLDEYREQVARHDPYRLDAT
jgi:predicted N-acyltransferase